MESTSLDDVLYRYASFRNLVDPITHDLIISLARYIHCPKPVGSCGRKQPSLLGCEVDPLSRQHRPDRGCSRKKKPLGLTPSVASSGTFSLAPGAA